jgi:hypothetical protein
MPFLHLLPQEVRDLVYTELIATAPSLQEQHRPYTLPLLVKCSIPTPLLLVSKAFSGELRDLLHQLQDIRVSVHDPTCNFVALWHRVPVHATRRLTVDLGSSSDPRHMCRAQWLRQYAKVADDDTATKIGFMVSEALSSHVCQLSITLELPELHVMAALADQLVQNSPAVDVEVSAYDDKFLGFKFWRLVLQLQGTHRQHRLRAEILLRSRHRHTWQT